jgi:biopolymer transport protein ExbD
MAGGGSLSVERSKRGKAGKRKKKKRIGFHLDMTPLVDITFLLLTFFMFTTTMAAPQVMEMSIPPERFTPVEVAEKELLQIYIRDDNKIFYAIGQDDPQEIKLSEIRPLAERSNLDPAVKNRLITSLKISDDAMYNTVVKVLDELNLAEAKITEEIAKELDDQGKPKKRERRFTIATLDEEDMKKLGEL